MKTLLMTIFIIFATATFILFQIACFKRHEESMDFANSGLITLMASGLIFASWTFMEEKK